MIAKVVVDVPSSRTNRPFDYRIPPVLADRVAVGSRVVVPFGPRMLQGYVVSVEEQSSPAHAASLKEIAEVPDDVPPLTEELLKLAEWMSHQYLCPWVTALQSMLPAVLKAKTEKRWTAGDQLNEITAQLSPLLQFLFHGGSVSEKDVRDQYPEELPKLARWQKEGLIKGEQQVQDRVTKKKMSYVTLAMTDEAAEELIASLPKRSERAKALLRMLLERGTPVSVKEVEEVAGISRTTVNSCAAKGWVNVEQREVLRDPYRMKVYAKPEEHVLTAEQENSLSHITAALERRNYASFLLHGVTGSGKTEVYLKAIECVLQQDREAIFLVPEISLTPQMVERLKGRFGNQVAVLHSGLSQGERYDEWRKIQRRQVQVAVGARSAIFAPFTNLGLIIMDEEHETSYKQEETPRYHARDIAVWRAKENGAVLLMGSATPALETYALATRGRHQLLTMTERVGGRKLPRVHVVDMREELRTENRSMFSRTLYDMIQDRLAKQEQIVLFLNRRGFSTFVMCRSCGHTLRCPHCDISLTYHKTNHTARCHYCGFSMRQPQHCPECQSPHIRFFGSGTQKIEAELAALFPGVRVIRMDVDTTSRKGAHEALLGKFRNGQADILVGTQMIAKGLDFPRVTLVGVIAADTSLHLPDFRAAEKTFQLLTQVGGRAGRHVLPGDVVIQTYTPEHYSIRFATGHDYTGFYEWEMRHRKQNGYPPFYRLVLMTFSHEEVPVVVQAAEQFARYLKPRLAPTSKLLGPVSSPIARLKDRFRFQLMLKYRDEPKLADLLAQAVAHHEDWMKQHQAGLTIDMDPQVLL